MQCPVTRFCALSTIGPHGAFVRADAFTPFLSAMIHCMQLWIIAFCIQSSGDDLASRRLELLVIDECKTFFRNDTHSPIAELSYWRLLTRKVGIDTAHHPVTHIDEDQTTVRYLDITLRFAEWRDTLNTLFLHAVTLLDDELMLGLHAAPQYHLSSIQDNFRDSRPGFCFFDDPRNDFRHAED